MAFRTTAREPKVAAMDRLVLVLNALVVFIQIALVAFVAWRGSLVVRERFRSRKTVEQGFERVASLVLLALLCTTIAGVA